MAVPSLLPILGLQPYTEPREEEMETQLTWGEGATELASRTGSGIEVALLWTRSTGRVVVAVRDDATGRQLEILVLPGENALDVFQHPFAYADTRQVRVALPV